MKYKGLRASRPGYINLDLTRYELHRVWIMQALTDGERNIYGKRRFYLAEESWQIAESEFYDGRGQLWRVGKAHLLSGTGLRL